jgi:hypothetical protein
MYKLIVIGLIFLLGLYFISQSNKVETFTTDSYESEYKISENCPDVLIQKGSALFLYNSKRANVAGVNPIRFENLEEYVEFTEWQRSQGILCPILFLQHAFNAQGDAVYKARPSPTNLQGGLPDFYITNKLANPNMIMPPPSTSIPIQGLLADAHHIDTTLIEEPNVFVNESNPNCADSNYTGFDAHEELRNTETPLDKMFNDNNKVSPNPMDSNWGGIKYTEKLITDGYYKGNEVSKGSFNYSTLAR